MSSIRRQLTLHLVLIFALLLGIGSGAIYLSERTALYRELDARLKVQAFAIAALTKPGKDGVEFEYPRRVLPMEGDTNRTRYYQLFSSNGVSLARSAGLAENDLAQRFGSLTSPKFWNLSLPDGTPGRAIGVRFFAQPPAKPAKKAKEPRPEEKSEPKEPKPPPPEPVEVGLVVADQRGQLEEQLSRLSLILCGVGGLTLIATVLLVPWALSRGLVPLRHLAAHAETMDASTIKQRFATHILPTELMPIVNRLNDLLGRLENSFERERRFSADLAHEMRTPLAGLRTTAEVAIKYPDNALGALQSVLEISHQMEQMLGRMLLLARSEHKTIAVDKQQVCLAAFVEQVWKSLEATAKAREISAQIKLMPMTVVETDPILFRGLLINLFANAIDHSPPGSTLQVESSESEAQFQLVVQNAAPELSPEDLTHFFERFWRKTQARTDAEHTGLGLALAKSFAETLGLSLSAKLTSGQVQFWVEGIKLKNSS